MREVVITLLIAICLISIFRGSRYTKDEPTIIKIIDTVYSKDTIVNYQKGKNIPYKVLDTVYNILTDTVTILHNYVTTKAYSDTIRQDSNTFYIQDTISENKIQGRGFKAILSQRTIFNTTTINLRPKNEVYLGVLGDLRRFDNKLGIGFNLIYKSQNKAYSVGLTTNQINVGYYVRFY